MVYRHPHAAPESQMPPERRGRVVGRYCLVCGTIYPTQRARHSGKPLYGRDHIASPCAHEGDRFRRGRTGGSRRSRCCRWRPRRHHQPRNRGLRAARRRSSSRSRSEPRRTKITQAHRFSRKRSHSRAASNAARLLVGSRTAQPMPAAAAPAPGGEQPQRPGREKEHHPHQHVGGVVLVAAAGEPPHQPARREVGRAGEGQAGGGERDRDRRQHQRPRHEAGDHHRAIAHRQVVVPQAEAAAQAFPGEQPSPQSGDLDGVGGGEGAVRIEQALQGAPSLAEPGPARREEVAEQPGQFDLLPVVGVQGDAREAGFESVGQRPHFLWRVRRRRRDRDRLTELDRQAGAEAAFGGERHAQRHQDGCDAVAAQGAEREARRPGLGWSQVGIGVALALGEDQQRLALGEHLVAAGKGLFVAVGVSAVVLGAIDRHRAEGAQDRPEEPGVEERRLGERSYRPRRDRLHDHRVGKGRGVVGAEQQRAAGRNPLGVETSRRP